MKQLDFDRAFPQTPDCIHAAIEMGFRKGQKKMKMQNKIIMLGSIAAALAIMFAAALATGGLNIAPQPDVLAQPPVTDVPKNEEAIHVYSTDGATFYHLKPDCSGMENAVEMSEIEAVRMGKKACPVCIPVTCNGHDGEEIELIYYSQGAKYFHKQEECNGGSFDLEGEYFTVTRAFPGKEPCTICFPNGIEECVHEKAFVIEVEPTLAPTPEEYTALNESATDSLPEPEEYVPTNVKEKTSWVVTDVYYTENGKYYHSDEHCQGMMNAKAHSREDAHKSHKLPCPLCLLVYAREGGTYFHLLPDCMGMLYADLYTQDEANAMGNQRCPLCLSPETVYATKLGNYFHVDEHCCNMQGAEATTPAAEWDNGKLPCPVCIAVNAYENEEEAIVYTTYGKPRYYHKTNVCNDQENKRELTLAKADKENLDPCPDCYATTTAEENTETTEPVFYCTPSGKYYHVEPDCSGMLNAEARTPEQVFINSGYTACPSCIDTDEEKALLMLPVPQADTDEVFIAPSNNYYHRDHGCFYMSMVIKADLKTAKDMGHTPCPMCFRDQVDLSSFETCWTTKNGKYYHSEEHCSGMQNAVSGLVEEALSLGKMRCPVCMKTTPENYDLFTTAFGQEIEDLYTGYIYDHTIGSEWFISNGRENFELCEVYPQGTAFFGEELPGLAELHLTDALAADPEQVDVFMKAAPAPIGSMYAAAPAEIEKQIRHEKITVEELQLMQVKVYFDANRQVSSCEMQFGFYDHVKLAWKVNTDGQIELTESEFVKPGWG